MAVRTGASVGIREARSEDNEELLALTRATPMEGVISIRIDRDPDFFELLRRRGTPTVFVAAEGDRIVGCISAAHRETFVSGRVRSVGYIGDLKVHPEHSGSGLAQRLIQTLEAHLRSMKADILFTLVAAGNTKVVSLLQGRSGRPQWSPVGTFHVHQILPWPVEGRLGGYEVRFAGRDELSELCEFRTRFSRGRQFAAVPTLEDVAADIGSGGPDENRVLVARQRGELVATVGLVDPSPAKKNVVLRMPPAVTTAVRLLAAVSILVPGWDPPRTGRPLRILFLRPLAYSPGHEKAAGALLRRARAIAFRERYTFVAVGLHETDPLNRVLRFIPRLTFRSEGFVLSLQGAPESELREGVPVEDYALV